MTPLACINARNPRRAFIEQASEAGRMEADRTGAVDAAPVSPGPDRELLDERRAAVAIVPTPPDVVSSPRAAMCDISKEEAAEFRGFFFGEGHLDLIRSGRTNGLVPRMRIAVRDDDVAVLEWCRSLFGGSLSRRAPLRSTCWQLTGTERLGWACNALASGVMPSKKRAEVALFTEALLLVSMRGRHQSATARARLFEIRAELIALRQFPGAA